MPTQILFNSEVVFLDGEFCGKKVRTGVFANGEVEPRVIVNIRKPHTIRRKLPKSSVETRKFLALLSDVLGVGDEVAVSPNTFWFNADANLDRRVIARWTALAACDAFGNDQDIKIEMCDE